MAVRSKACEFKFGKREGRVGIEKGEGNYQCLSNQWLLQLEWLVDEDVQGEMGRFAHRIGKY